MNPLSRVEQFIIYEIMGKSKVANCVHKCCCYFFDCCKTLTIKLFSARKGVFHIYLDGMKWFISTLLQLAAKLGCQTSETESYAASETPPPQNHSTSNILLNLSWSSIYRLSLATRVEFFRRIVRTVCPESCKFYWDRRERIRIVQIWLLGDFATVSFCSE